MNEIMSYTDPEILTYRPRIYGRGEPQYWELRDRLGYRVTADLYTTEEVLYRERRINEWRKTPAGREYGTVNIVTRYW